MATLTSDAVRNGMSPIADEAGETVVVRAVFAITSAIPLNDVIDMAIIPAEMLPADFTVDLDDLDGGITMVLDGGIMTGIPGDVTTVRTVNTVFFAGATTGQTGGVIRPAVASAFRQVSAPVDRSFGIRVSTAAGTPILGSLAGLVNRNAWEAGTPYAVNDYITLPNGVVMVATTGGVSAVYGTDRQVPLQFVPNWVLGKGLTTQDNSVVWTCHTPIIGLCLYLRPAVRFL